MCAEAPGHSGESHPGWCAVSTVPTVLVGPELRAFRAETEKVLANHGE